MSLAMPLTQDEQDALKTVSEMMHTPLRERYTGDSGIQSNYPRGLAHMADWDIHGRWVQKVVDQTRAHLVAAGLMERGEESGWQKEQRAKETREHRAEICEVRRLRRQLPPELRRRAAYNAPSSVINRKNLGKSRNVAADA